MLFLVWSSDSNYLLSLATFQSGWTLLGLSSRTWMAHALLLLYQCFALTVDSHRLSLLSLIAFAFENGISLGHLEPMVLELWKVVLRTKMQSLSPHKHRTKRVSKKESCWPISMVFSFLMLFDSFLILASYFASLLPVSMQVGFFRLHVSTEHFSTQLLPLYCRLIQVTLHNSWPSHWDVADLESSLIVNDMYNMYNMISSDFLEATVTISHYQ